jgi:ABC-type transporter MlaC component
MQKVYNLSFVFDFWEKIKDKGTKLDYYKEVLSKYAKEYESNPVDTCRGTKMMLGQLYNPKHPEEKEKFIKLHE